MGIARLEPNPTKEQEQATPFTIVKKTAEPVLIASKKFYHTNPKEALELILAASFLVLSFVGELIGSLPWLWYVAFILWIVSYSNLPFVLKKALTPRKRKRHAPPHSV